MILQENKVIICALYLPRISNYAQDMFTVSNHAHAQPASLGFKFKFLLLGLLYIPILRKGVDCNFLCLSIHEPFPRPPSSVMGHSVVISLSARDEYQVMLFA